MSDAEANEGTFWRINNPLVWGVLVTTGLFILYTILAFQSDCVDGICETKISQFFSASPNEIGDTLAGLAGGLAFLWIIVTVLLQAQELREQRKELVQSRKEYAKMVAALEAQAEIFRDEKKYRQYSKAKNLLDEKLIGLLDRVYECAANWTYDDNDGQLDWIGDVALFGNRESLPTNIGTSTDECLKYFVKQSINFIPEVEKAIETNSLRTKSDEFTNVIHIRNMVEDIVKMKSSLSGDQVARLNNIRLALFLEKLTEILKLQIWLLPKVPMKEPKI